MGVIGGGDNLPFNGAKYATASLIKTVLIDHTN